MKVSLGSFMLGATTALAAALVIGWVMLGRVSVTPQPSQRLALQGAPAVDLDRIDQAAAAMQPPRAALADATRKCRLFRKPDDCRYADELKMLAEKNGLD